MKIRKTPEQFIRSAAAFLADNPEATKPDEPTPVKEKTEKPKKPAARKAAPKKAEVVKPPELGKPAPREVIFPNTKKQEKERMVSHTIRVPESRYGRLLEYLELHGRRNESINFMFNEGIDVLLEKRGFTKDDSADRS
jgi:type IV secretory pathway VirB10-like protein